MRQYEVWWADLPEPIGRRPVLILTRGDALKYLSRCVVAEVTTAIRGIAQEVELGSAEGLPQRCAANLDSMHVVPIRSLRSRAGTLATSRHREVKHAAGHVFGWAELMSP